MPDGWTKAYTLLLGAADQHALDPWAPNSDPGTCHGRARAYLLLLHAGEDQPHAARDAGCQLCQAILDLSLGIFAQGHLHDLVGAEADPVTH